MPMEKPWGELSLKAVVCYQKRAFTLVSTAVVSQSLLLRHLGLLNKEVRSKREPPCISSHGYFHPEGEIVPTTIQVLQANQLIHARVPALYTKGSPFGIYLFNINSQKALPTSSYEFPTLPGKSPNQPKSKSQNNILSRSKNQSVSVTDAHFSM